MQQSQITIFLSLLSLFTCSTFHNPIIWSDVPDIDMIRVEDTYYMVSTTMFFCPGAPIMKSKDLSSWEICSYAYITLADDNKHNLKGGDHDYGRGSWAASIRYRDGTFYVFFTSLGTGKSYVCRTNDIEGGKWTTNVINGVYHDASILFDDNGKNFLVYGTGTINIKELNHELTDFVSGERKLFATGLSGLAGEGSHILKINGYYYIFIIAWPSGKGRIELVYRSKELMGNYEGKTILDSGVGTYGSGAAQGAIIDTPDGKWYGYIFQDHGGVGRVPVITPMTWVDGWPMMGVNGKVPVTIELEKVGGGTHLAVNDEFEYSENKLKLEWQWNHNPDNTAWSVTERKGFLRLKNNNMANHLLNARNSLTMRTEGPACSGEIKIDVSKMNPGDFAGLAAFQFNYGKVGVHIGDDGKKLVYMARNGGYGKEIKDSRDQIVKEIGVNNEVVYLKVDFKFNNVDGNFNSSNNIDKVNFFYSLDGTTWTKIGDEIGMTYDLKMFTGYRFAIYSYPTKKTGGYVDVDYCKYSRAQWN